MAMTSDAYWFQSEMAGGAPWDVDANTKSDEHSTRRKKKSISDTNARRGSAFVAHA